MGHECTRILEFDAAHRLQNHAGKCQHLHGHRYKVEITCRAQVLDPVGMVVDFGCIKGIVGGWIDAHLDHNTIYEAGDQLMNGMDIAWGTRCRTLNLPRKSWHEVDFAPTCENLAKYLFEQASRLLNTNPDPLLVVSRVRLWETPNCYADWCGS